MINLTFLNSAFLIGLTAAILPILIHLFSKQKVKVIMFSSLEFLKELQRKKIKQLKLRQLLLLILRVLIIVLLALALSRPTIKNIFASGVKSHAKTTVVIIIDNSFSMGFMTKDASLFDIAKEKALAIANLLKEGDSAALIYMSETPDVVIETPTHNFDLLKERIEKSKLSSKPTDIYSSLVSAYKILETSKDLNKEIYLITDKQKYGFLSLMKQSDEQQKSQISNLKSQDVRLYIISVLDDDKENLSVDAVDYSNQIIQISQPIRISATITNHSDEPVKDKLVQIYIDDEPKGQAGISIEPHKSQLATFSVTISNGGFHYGYVKLQDDELLEDNKYYFTIYVMDKVKTLIVDDSNEKKDDYSSGFYLNLAFKPTPQSRTLIEPTLVSLKDFDKIKLDDYSVIVLSNVSELSQTGFSVLLSAVKEGKGLLIILGDKVNIKYYNDKLLPAFCPLVIKTVVGKESSPLLGSSSADKSQSGFLTLRKIDYSHSIFSIFSDKKKGNLESPQFYRFFITSSGTGLTSLAKFGDGQLAMAESKIGLGRVILWTSDITNQSWSDMPTKGIFVPLLHRTVQYLGSGTVGVEKNFIVGETMVKEVESLPYGEKVKLIRPDGDEEVISPQQRGTSIVLESGTLNSPGIYHFQVGKEVINSFSVNLNNSESDLSTISNDEIKTLPLFNKVPLSFVSSNSKIEDSILQSRYGRELWKILLGLALILMVIEMFVGRVKEENT